MASNTTITQPDEVVVKHKTFGYFEEVDDPLSTTGETRLVERFAPRGTKLTKDQLRETDWKVGMRHGAFYTEEELNPALVEAESVRTVADMTDDELVAWIRGDSGTKPTISQVTGAAGTDPELAQRLINAENHATGNDPRKGLVEALTTIADRGNQ